MQLSFDEQDVTLFDEQADAARPLAARMRPETLDEVAGQQHLIGPGKVLRRIIEADQVQSMIFWGPPGVGKTTLARVIAHQTQATFIDFSAVTSGIKEIRNVMEKAERNRQIGQRTIVFVDEIHRFNKSQQDVLLPYVEDGRLVPTHDGWLMGNELYGALWDLAEGTPITSETS